MAPPRAVGTWASLSSRAMADQPRPGGVRGDDLAADVLVEDSGAAGWSAAGPAVDLALRHAFFGAGADQLAFVLGGGGILDSWHIGA